MSLFAEEELSLDPNDIPLPADSTSEFAPDNTSTDTMPAPNDEFMSPDEGDSFGTAEAPPEQSEPPPETLPVAPVVQPPADISTVTKEPKQEEQVTPEVMSQQPKPVIEPTPIMTEVSPAPSAPANMQVQTIDSYGSTEPNLKLEEIKEVDEE